MKPQCPKEHDEQVALMQMVSLIMNRHPELALLHAIPNGGHRNVVVAKRLKDEGVKPGVPDLFLPVARGGSHGLYVEMKRIKGGRVSEVQKDWIRALMAQGYKVEVAKGAVDAFGVIKDYISS